MAGQNIVELGFNVEELSVQKKQVLDLFVDLFGKLHEYDGTKFNPLGAGGLSDLKKSLTDGANAMNQFTQAGAKYNQVVTDQAQKQSVGKKTTDELTLATKEFQKIVDQTAQTQAKANASTSNSAENLAIEKEQLKQSNAERQKAVQYLLAETGSVNEAKAAVAQLTLERNKQNASSDEGKAKIEELNAAITKQNDFIRANVSALEQQKINIGNYTSATVILKESLDTIGVKLQQMAESGDIASEAYQKLVLEQTLLQQLQEKQSGGFATVTAELRSQKSALDSLAIAGLENTEAFRSLNTVYESAKQKLTELHNQQKILTSDNPALNALTASARGLGGAYALGAGASALFAEGNEKVEKELNKLVAVMTLLQGLEEAVRALKERGAIATALQGIAIKGLNAVREIETRLFGENTIAMETETAVKEVNTEATLVNTEAVEANAAGTQLNTEAMEGTVIATEAASAATIGLRTVLISTGIGALIIGIIYGITKLIGVISDWASADERTEKSQKALSASTAELLETTKQLNEAYAQYSKERIDNLNKANALDQAAGKNQFVILANEKATNDARLAIAKKYVDQKKIDQTTVNDLYAKQVDALEIVTGFEEQLRTAQKAYGEDDSKENKKRVEDLQKVIEQQKADAKNVTTQYVAVRDALKEVGDAEQAVNDNRIKTSKATAEEIAKILADGAQRQFNITKDNNDRILALDTSTEAERQAAIKRNYLAEDALAESQIRAIQLQVKNQAITEQEGSDQILTIQTDLNIKRKKALDDHLKTTIEYRDRELAARNSIGKNNNDSDAAVQDAITKDLQQELDTRLAALQKSIDDKTKIIVDDYNYQLKLAKEHGKTQEEIDLLASDRDKALVALTADTQKQIYDITVSFGERRLKAVEELNKTGSESNAVSTDYNKQKQALDESLLANIISYSKYIRDRQKLDQEYSIEKTDADVADDKEALARLLKFENDELKIKQDAAQRDLDAAKAGGNQDDIKNAQAKVDALKDVAVKGEADIVAATKKLNDDEAKNEEAKVDRILKARATLKERTTALEEESFQLAKTLVDAGYENQINKIQTTINLVDQQAEAEIAAVQRSTLSQRDQAAEVIILQANQKAKDTQLKNEQKQEKIKEAKFDRDVAVAKIGWATAQAVMKDTAGVPWPLSLEVAAVDIALGAVQAAIVLATPIPTYAEGIGIPGKGEHAGGLAWVGEEGRPEQVAIPGQQPFVVDRATLLDLPAKSQVLPLNANNLVFELGGAAMARGSAQIIRMSDSRNDEVTAAIRLGAAQTVRAIKKSQKKIQNIINIKVDPTWGDYVKKKITGVA